MDHDAFAADCGEKDAASNVAAFILLLCSQLHNS
jgi:hypothetical protein